jgi:prepilin-type N-terminal cleavage/methylation domain-containing protein
MKTNRKRTGITEERGFSLVELIVVVGIISLGVMIGIPTYNTTIRPTADLNAAARRLYSDIQDARMMAIRNNTRYGLAFFSGPDRYILFVDNATANGQYDSGEQTIRTLTLADEYGSIVFDTGCAGCGGDGITFAGNAFSMNTRALASTGGAIYLKNKKNEGRTVTVNTMGSVQIAEYTP